MTPCLSDEKYVVKELPQEGAVSGSYKKIEDGNGKNVQFAKGQSCLLYIHINSLRQQ